MIESFSELSNLYDHVEFMTIELGKLTLILIGFFAVDVVSAQPPCPVRFDDLNAMVVVQRRGYNFMAVVVGLFATAL